MILLKFLGRTYQVHSVQHVGGNFHLTYWLMDGGFNGRDDLRAVTMNAKEFAECCYIKEIES